jgi:hypothetical protein
MLKIPPFDKLRVVSEVEPPEAGLSTQTPVEQAFGSPLKALKSSLQPGVQTLSLLW